MLVPIRTRVKEALPWWLACAIARCINRPFLAELQRSERLTEYAWVLGWVGRWHATMPGEIMDFGYAGSYLAEALCQYGRVLGVDPRATPTITHRNFRRYAALEHAEREQFDTIVCVSVLEHLSQPLEWVERLFARLLPMGGAAAHHCAHGTGAPGDGGL